MKPSFYKKHRSTLYIFPALLPLAELLPWLLALIATLAGWAQHFYKRQERTQRIILALAAACLAGAIGIFAWAQITQSSAADGPSTLLWAGDISRHQVFQTAIPPQPAPTVTEEPHLLWSVKTDKQNLGNPVISGDLLLIGTYQGTVEARALANGEKIWAVQKKEPVFTSAAIGKNTAFIGEGVHSSAFSRLTALSLPNGKPLWERKFHSHIESQPVIDEEHNRLWFGSGANGFWALAMQDGAVLWHSPIGHIDVAPLYQKQRLFITAKADEKAEGSALFELDPASGKTIRSVDLPGNPMGAIMPGPDDSLLFTTGVGQVGVTKSTDTGWAHAYSMDGKMLWSAPLPAAPLPDGVLLKDISLLFLTLKNGALLALDTKTGKAAWQEKLGEGFNTDAALIEDGGQPLVAAVTTDGIASVRDARTGKEYYRFDVPKNTYSAPLYRDGVLYITLPYEIRAYQWPQKKD